MHNHLNFDKFVGKKILIVDDIPNNLKALAGFLTPLGLKVIPAMNGVHAISLAEAKSPDLILLDVMMPEIDGFEVCRILKSNPLTNSIPIVFLTGKTDTDDIVSGFEAGGSDYLTKPFNYKELLARVFVQLELKTANDIILNQNNQLLEQKQSLVKLNATKDKFFSIIAHDLRNPLGSFKNISEYLSSNLDDMPREEQKEFLDLMKDTANNVFSLLENLLEWSSSQRGALKFAPEDIQLDFLVKQTLSVLELNAKNKGITLNSNIPNDCIVFVDSKMINTVIRNLTSNAIKFTNEGGNINIIAKHFTDCVQISVEDDGLGMDELSVAKLFRIDVNHSTLGTNEEKGTGLGLILCKEFVEKNSGRIWVESELGVGSKFIFTVPKHFENELEV